MGRSAIEDEVLGRCADDYEAPHTITGDISRDTGRSVTEKEVRTAFLALAGKGLVQPYVFESASGRYVAISAAEAEHHDAAWFFITADGREVMNNEAS